MSTAPIEIRQANAADLDRIAPLFDAYRRFYGRPADLEGARRFLAERFAHHESIIFLALTQGGAVGFTQLYLSFSSVSMGRIYILNDLFVMPEARGSGAGRALLEAAAEYGRSVGALRLALSTELTNTTAQALYERCGWTRDSEFCHYQLTL